ncbi:CBASS cGAMP-activated phospholipase [Texcoconibacillus texcoconensis]|uniref:PNPLA domain-containing protein n=1 Tax=Texcoconibacillus texcoconensis TaxID=1095777 RepID=A0A840QMA9_9BACI|nr:CBASS cGAMP-activated phospholipase [Texcoconibacillus texcoconensis]MBB5172497.1 hypothetical protein [Texcoconibacillus texcoconensis]
MRMLCIDGGGMRGVFAVSILKEIEKTYGKPIGEYFDVVAGTSTGAIIASSIATHKSMSNVLDGYFHFGEKIFARQAKIGLLKSMYSHRGLRRFFKYVFGNVTLADIDKPLLLTASDVTNAEPYIYRSNFGHPDAEDDLSLKLSEAVICSSAAPIYFPPNIMEGDLLSVDGGLWANNPSFVCLTEAVDFFEKPMSDIEIVSIGTGEQKIDFTVDEDASWGLNRWLPVNVPSMKVTPKLIDLMLHLTSESVSYQCQQLLGKRYMRLNKNLGKEIPIDDVESMEEMTELGKQLFHERREEIEKFLGV